METAGWQRTGTLPREAARSYTVLPQQDPDDYPPPGPAVELGNRRRDGGETTESAGAGARRGRGRRGMDRLAATLTLQRRRKPSSRAEVEKTLPKFWPVATVLVAIAELGLLTALLVQNGFAPISFNPRIVNDVIEGFGNYSEFVTRHDVPNFFIGPSGSSLIHAGAKYTPCMRDNVQFRVDAAQDRAEENSLRCCLGPPVSRPQCGMLPQGVCTVMYENSVVLGGESVCQAEMNNTEYCTGGVVLHPCCVGLLGDCVVTTEENCTFHKGHWHPDKLLCSEVSTQCFKDICELTWSAPGRRPQQGVRFLSAIFLYEGIIHWILIALFKIPVMWKIETRISWLRVTLIYVLSGIGGYVVSGIFEATSLSVGGSGSLFGLFGVLLVELLQGWRWVRRPCVELLKLCIFIIFMLALGLLPYIDNYSQIGGFLVGILSSFIFIPYITLGKWDRAKKLCLILTAVPLILAFFLVGFVVFYNLPYPDFCPSCSYINCVPITRTFCDDFITNVVSSAVPTQPPQT
ncbi:Inactive rhomboid protein 1 [Geodia barretti]|nr:Inactive rhomboid protein 1 [Geodia barretti]